jgi:hypothetical protein
MKTTTKALASLSIALSLTLVWSASEARAHDSSSVLRPHLAGTPTLKISVSKGLTIQEIREGKARISSTFSSILKHGWDSNYESILVVLIPRRHDGAQVFEDREKLYVTVSATEDQIERGLLEFFVVKVTHQGRTYFPGRYPSVKEFQDCVAKVEKVIARFQEHGLPLRFHENQSITVDVADPYSGRPPVFGDRTIFVAITATEDQIERHLMNFFDIPEDRI